MRGSVMVAYLKIYMIYNKNLAFRISGCFSPVAFVVVSFTAVSGGSPVD